MSPAPRLIATSWVASSLFASLRLCGRAFFRIAAHCALVAATLLSVSHAVAADKKPPVAAKEDDFYKLTPIAIPNEINLEGGGLELMPNGRLAVSTRRGDIYMVENPASSDVEKIKFHLFAGGLHEVLGLAQKDGWLYAQQRCELTRLRDDDGDGRADRFETVSDFWELTGDYHEYAFCSKFDKRGDLWTVLCLTGSYDSNAKYRGWCVRTRPDGKTVPTCSGVRSPGGIGMDADGEMFFTENQGPWNGACAVKHLKPGGFVGHPGGNKWYAEPEAAAAMGPRPPDPKSGSRIAVEEKRVPQLVPTAVILPYNKMGQSAAGIATDMTAGKFGPFARQMFVSDQAHSTVMRVFLEKVDGVYQGACFPFRQGFGSGALSMLIGPSGEMYVGGTNRGWGSRGGKPYSLDRVAWTGKVPLEIHEMRIKPDGFELTFTQPVDPAAAGDLKSYALSTFTYIYQANYGSPEVDATRPTLKSATVAADGKSVRLAIDGLMLGHVHELHAAGIRGADGQPLLHNAAYYTLNRLPK